MRRNVISILLLFATAFAAAACGGREAATPVETFKIYVRALRQNDMTTVKMLLSSETLRMHQEEARSQNVPLDEIVRRETLFTGDQRKIEFRNETVDGGKASIEVKNAAGDWESVPFIFEDEQWKIDKKSFAERLLQDIEQQNDALRRQLDPGATPPEPAASP